MAANVFTPLINGDTHLQSQPKPQNEKSTARLLTGRALIAVVYTFFGAAMLMMYILLSSSSSSSANYTSTNANSGALTIRSNVSIQATTPSRSVVGSTTSTTTTIDSNNLSSSDGKNNDPNSVGPSSSLRASTAAAALVSSGEGKMGSCRTTGSTIPYKYNGQTFGEPLFPLEFQASSYAIRSWKDQREFLTFDKAWQACATQCNHEHRCHTYTADIHTYTSDIFYDPNPDNLYGAVCYLHDPYKSVYGLDTLEWPPTLNGHVSGVCRLNDK